MERIFWVGKRTSFFKNFLKYTSSRFRVFIGGQLANGLSRLEPSCVSLLLTTNRCWSAFPIATTHFKEHRSVHRLGKQHHSSRSIRCLIHSMQSKFILAPGVASCRSVGWRLLPVARGFRTFGPLRLVNLPSSTLGEFRIKGLQGMTAISNSETCDKRILGAWITVWWIPGPMLKSQY